MRRVGLTFVALNGILCVGCGQGTPQGTYAGRVPDTNAWIAISVSETTALAFITASGDEVQTYTRWMEASVERDLVQLEADGWSIDLFVNDTWASGDLIDPAGSKWPFKIDQNGDLGVTGLYSANDSGCRDGVIVLGSGPNEFEAVGAWCDTEGQIAAATPIRPLSIGEEGVEVVAATNDGPREFFVEEVYP